MDFARAPILRRTPRRNEAGFLYRTVKAHDLIDVRQSKYPANVRARTGNPKREIVAGRTTSLRQSDYRIEQRRIRIRDVRYVDDRNRGVDERQQRISEVVTDEEINLVRQSNHEALLE
jgi:hypothetical protein